MYDGPSAPRSTTTTTTSPAQGNYAGEALTAIGGLTSAYASYMAGRANKKIADFNARMARVQAAQAIQAGEFNANRVAIAAQRQQGAAQAAEAGAGIVAGAGTAKAVEASNEAASNMDRLMIELNARREAYGFQVRAAADTMEGKLAEQKGAMQAGAALLDTGAQEWLESDPAYGGFRGRGLDFGMR
jgi:hypothetical protein